METKQRAENILNYCIEWLMPHSEIISFSKSKRYKEMLKEINFLIDSD